MENLVRMSVASGSWQKLKDDWRAQCAAHDEDFDVYGLASFGVLDPLAAAPEAKAGVYALRKGEEHHAVCQLNCARLPAYQHPVLRVRHLMFAPKYDFGDYNVDKYAELLVSFFGGVIRESLAPTLRSKHIHFHLRSPADLTFFKAVGLRLNEAGTEPFFESVSSAGAWLYIEHRTL